MSETQQLASRLRERIIVEVPALSDDGLGGNVQTWEEVAVLFAEVMPARGWAREQVIAAQRETRSIYRVIVRQRDDLTSAMRIQWRGRILHIHGITQEHSVTEIIAFEGGEA